MKDKTQLKFQTMVIKTSVFILFASFFLINCSPPSTLSKKFEGIWKIEEINFKNENYTDKLYINVIAFDEKNVNIPETKDYRGESKAEWQIIEHSKIDTLVINSHSKIFNGKYQLTFAQDSIDSSVHAKLVSRTTLILLHKINLGTPSLGNDILID